MRGAVTAYLGLGANLGDREAAIRGALDALGAVPGVEVTAVSTLRETAPVGGPPQGPYLNGAARVETTLSPRSLLAVCKELERAAGRDPAAERDAPRPLDLDLLLFGEQRIDARDLVVPHPRMHQREFVLEPLRELGVSPDAVARWERPEVVTDFERLRARCDAWAAEGCEIGLVPTMGALHEGHLSLVRRARAECDRVVVTIFVNPLQFGPHEDFSEYPRRLAEDLECLRAEAVHVVFAPEQDSIPEGFCSYIGVGAEAEAMEGRIRPGHFSGVATIVAILWGVVRPDRAYFGRKDAQQVAVLRRLQRDLRLSGELVECAIVRERDGLALSSRNVRLGPDDRRAAAVLYRALRAARDAHAAGERSAAALVETAQQVLRAEPRCSLDYLELRRDDDLGPLPDGSADTGRLLVAARFGSTRLIDNDSLTGPD